MRTPFRLLLFCSPLLLTQCATDPDNFATGGAPGVPDSLTGEDEKPFAADTDPGGLPPVNSKDGPVTIRDRAGKERVSGQVKGGRMQGVWIFRDPQGEKLAEVSYRGDIRHGPVVLRYVTADGPAAGKMRMQGTYDMGNLNGKVRSYWPDGRDKFMRDFDSGTLESVSGTRRDGSAMPDGEAMNLAVQDSREEDTLLLEFENFVQLHIRRAGALTPGPIGE